jgi:hypothetical protein
MEYDSEKAGVAATSALLRKQDSAMEASLTIINNLQAATAPFEQLLVHIF